MSAERPAVVSKGRRVFVLVAALVLMAITARAGWWQLDRAAQKLALQSSIEGRAGLPPLSAAELAVGAREAEAQWHRPAAVQGEWMGEHTTVFLDNRQMGGRPGFFVLSALRLAGGDAVLVQRGWVPRDAQDRSRLPSVPLPAGTVLIQARVAPWPSRLVELGEQPAGRIRQNLDAAAYAGDIGVRLRPLSLVQTAAEAGPDGLQRQWPKPAIDIHKHYGYAAQWFTFCAMIAGLYVWFQLLRPRLRRTAG